jgi:hypothetical protein
VVARSRVERRKSETVRGRESRTRNDDDDGDDDDGPLCSKRI